MNRTKKYLPVGIVMCFICMVAVANAATIKKAQWPMGGLTLRDDGTFTFQLPSRSGKPIELAAIELTVDGKPAAIDGKVDENGYNLIYKIVTKTGKKISASLVCVEPGIFRLDMRTAPTAAVAWDLKFRAAKDEHFYGFGEKFNSLDQRGLSPHILNLDALSGHGDKSFRGDRSYKTVAFMSSSRGYGVWLDNPIESTFDMDSGGSGEYSIRFTDSFIRIYIFAGPRPADVMTRFTSISGRPPVWPGWAFAPWKSRDVHRSRADVEEDILRHRELDLPTSVIVIDSPWETCYHDFKFNEKQFRKSADMIQMAHDYGYKIVVWTTPFINIYNTVDMGGIRPSKCPDYDRVQKFKGFMTDENGRPAIVDWWKGTGSLLDFTNPDTVNFWKKKFGDLEQLGVDGVKTDDGEGGTYLKAMRFHDPMITPDRMRNHLANIYNKATYEAMNEATKGNTVIWARSGMAGTQKYSVPWAGDNHSDFGRDGLPSVIIAGQSIAMSGYPIWGHDIAGYIGVPTPELFVRWTQFAALTPIMQVHMTTNKGAWDYGSDALDIYRKYAKLHTSLFPYIYTYAKRAAIDGLPLIRPLPFVDPDDPESHVQRYEYLFGDNLLVAPVVQAGATTREVYFPRGARWRDFWSDRSYPGGKKAVVPAPLDTLPLFVRVGSVIPTLPQDVDTLVEKSLVKQPGVVAMDDRLSLIVYPDEKTSTMAMYDGSKFNVIKSRRDVVLRISTKARPLTVAIDSGKPKKVELNGKKFEQKECGKPDSWCFRKENSSVTARFETKKGATVLKIWY